MTVVSAFLVPGSPLPLLKPENLPWGRLSAGYTRAGRALQASQPDTILVYSTQWMAVLDQLWQTRPKMEGLHVDENWYEYGDMRFKIAIDTELTYACIDATPSIGIRSKEVNYDGFPIDSGTITAHHFLNQGNRYPLTITSNNLYHSPEQTEKLSALAIQKAHEFERRVAVVGVGGLSGTIFRKEIDIRRDHIASREDDRWNRKILNMIERVDVSGLYREIPNYVKNARVDMGFKHFYWLLGALGGHWLGAQIHAYGPLYGSGGAVVEFRI